MDVMSDDVCAVGVLEPARRGGATTALLYRVDDPLVVDLILWQPRTKVGLFRSVLRADLLRVARGGAILCGDVSVALATPRFIRIVIEHEGGSIVAIHGSDAFRAFLEATQELVPATESAETRRVDRLVAEELDEAARR